MKKSCCSLSLSSSGFFCDKFVTTPTQNVLQSLMSTQKAADLEFLKSVSWRNNNPGNLLIGDFARRNGAIGWAGCIKDTNYKFAVFPDYATGRQAQAKRLKEGTMYIDLT